MSASRSSYSKQDRVFQFSMEFPVPSYLVALVAGDLQHVDVGPRSVPGSWSGSAACFSSSRNQFPGYRSCQHVLSRSRVWAEPCLLSCAAKKLGGSVERWLGVAEELFGPYLWGR